MSPDSKRGDRGRSESVEKTNKYLKLKKLGEVKDWYHPEKKYVHRFWTTRKKTRNSKNILRPDSKQADRGRSESVENTNNY